MKEKWNFLGNYDTDDKLWDQKPKNHGLSELNKMTKKKLREEIQTFSACEQSFSD